MYGAMLSVSLFFFFFFSVNRFVLFLIMFLFFFLCLLLLQSCSLSVGSYVLLRGDKSIHYEILAQSSNSNTVKFTY